MLVASTSPLHTPHTGCSYSGSDSQSKYDLTTH
jgi:hypothetical protein